MKQVIGLISFCLFSAIILPAQLSLTIESQTVTVGEEFCLEVSVTGFQDILSFQAQFLQDDSLLTYTQFSDSRFPDDLWEDPYAHDARIAWVANDLINGSSVEDGTSLISICFKAQKSGVAQVSIFKELFDLRFLPLEVYNDEEQLIDVTVEAGIVIIEEPSTAKEEINNENFTTATADNQVLAPSFDLYPTLVENFIQINSEENTVKDIYLYSLDGILYQQLTTSDKIIEIATTGLAKGSYFITIHTAKGMVYKRFLKI